MAIGPVVDNGFYYDVDLDHTLNVMAKRAVESLHAKGCTLRLVEKGTRHLYLAAAHGLSETYLYRGEVES